MSHSSKDHSQIEGWGSDLAAESRPGVPREKNELSVLQIEREPSVPQQVAHHKIYMSIERPHITPVFGTTCPPSGLSQYIRNFAYKYSEGRLARWIPLLLADRVNVVEGLITDLARGKIPNFFSERGVAAEWRYDKRAFALRMAKIVVITGATIWLTRRLIKKAQQKRQSRF